MSFWLLVTLAGVEFCAILFIGYKIVQLYKLLKKAGTADAPYSFLIIAPSLSPQLLGVIGGFTRYLRRHNTIPMKMYECIFENTSHSLDDILLTLTHQKIPLIVTFGTLYTERILNKLRNHGLEHVRVISSAAIAETMNPPLTTYRKQGLHVTGTMGSISWNDYLKKLKTLFPHVQAVLAVYPNIENITHAGMIDKNAITHAAYVHKINCHMLHLSSLHTIDVPKEVLKKIDFVIISRGFFSISHIGTQLFSFFEQHGIPILTPDITQVQHNVFMGIANNTEERIGMNTAQQTLLYARNEKDVNQIPIHTVDVSPTIAVNLSYPNKELVEQTLSRCGVDNKVSLIITKPQ